jgi:hypothetical protein
VALEKDGENQLDDCVRNEKILQRVKEERNILHTIKRMKADWIGHILCRNCLLEHVIEGKMGGKSDQMTVRKREDSGN